MTDMQIITCDVCGSGGDSINIGTFVYILNNAVRFLLKNEMHLNWVAVRIFIESTLDAHETVPRKSRINTSTN